MNRVGIYLAGAMSCYDNSEFEKEAIRWRMSLKSYFSDSGDLIVDIYDPTLIPTVYGDDVVSQNLHYINKMDIVVVNVKDLDKSFGTVWEIVTANQKGKPIIAYGNHEWLNHPHLKPMVSYKSTNLSSIADYIHDVYRY